MKSVNICNENLAYSSTVPIDGITDIDMSIVMGDLELIAYDESNLLVELYFENPNYLLRFRVSAQRQDSTIKIVLEKAHILFDLFSFISVSIRVYIPKAYKNNISIKGAALNVWMNDFNDINSVKVLTVSGRCQTSNVHSSAISLDCTSGSVQLNEIHTDHLTVDSKAGSLQLENIHLKNADAPNTSIKVNLISGKVNASVLDCFDSITITAISGSAFLAVPHDYNFTSNYSTVSGKTKVIDANNPPAQINNDRRGTVTMSTVSGSVTIAQ